MLYQILTQVEANRRYIDRFPYSLGGLAAWQLSVTRHSTNGTNFSLMSSVIRDCVVWNSEACLRLVNFRFQFRQI
jgi:hypothetical protein